MTWASGLPCRTGGCAVFSCGTLRPCVACTGRGRVRHWPRAVAGCLILAACGGGGGSHQSSARPTASATTAAEPTSGPAAVAAITANWKTVFNGKAPIPSRLALVQDGPQVAAFVEAQAKTSFGTAATGSTATISSVTITSPTQATVHYEVLLLGTPLLKNQVGTAVYPTASGR